MQGRQTAKNPFRNPESGPGKDSMACMSVFLQGRSHEEHACKSNDGVKFREYGKNQSL